MTPYSVISFDRTIQIGVHQKIEMRTFGAPSAGTPELGQVALYQSPGPDVLLVLDRFKCSQPNSDNAQNYLQCNLIDGAGNTVWQFNMGLNEISTNPLYANLSVFVPYGYNLQIAFDAKSGASTVNPSVQWRIRNINAQSYSEDL